MAQVDDNEALARIGQAFKGNVSILEDVITIIESQPTKDDSNLVNRIGSFLCEDYTACTYHIGRAKELLTIVKYHYNIK